MRPLTAVIVDDEPLARARLQGLLAGEPEVAVVGECGTANEALDTIERTTPDVLFLDVQLPGCSGLQLLQRISPGRRPAVIFATAHERFALEAFELGATDYLLKPFDRDRLRVALRRVRDQLGPRAAEVPAASRTNRLMWRSEGRIVLLRGDEICWVEADDNHAVLHLEGQGNLVVRETLASIEERLAPLGFIRISRSALVPIEDLKELAPGASAGDWVVVLRDGTRLPVSRAQRRQLERAMGLG